MNLTVNLTAGDTPELLRSTAAALANGQELHEAIRDRVESTVGDHLNSLNSRSPNTDYYASAARGIETAATAGEALIRIPKLGFALRYYGGRVEPGKGVSSHTGKPTRALAIPTDDVPIVGAADGRHRQRPGQAGLLAFIPARNSAKTVGYLVEGVEKVITRGKNKGKNRVVSKPGGNLLYVLAKYADHAADESVLPSTAVLLASASDAAYDYIDSFTDEGGDS